MTPMNLDHLAEVAGALLAPSHREPINPKANYRTRDIALFEEASRGLTALIARVREAEKERDEANRRAAPVGGTDNGERRTAAKKLLCDICACSAETDPASLDLPHVVADCLEPLETLIAERDACLYLAQQAHKYAGRDGHDIFDAIAEKAAANSRAQAAEARVAVLAEALEPFAAVAEGALKDVPGVRTGDDVQLWQVAHRFNRKDNLTIGDFRRARAALSPTSTETGE